MIPFDDIDDGRSSHLATWAMVIALTAMVVFAGLAAATGGRAKLGEEACVRAAANLATNQPSEVMTLRSVNQDCPRAIG